MSGRYPVDHSIDAVFVVQPDRRPFATRREWAWIWAGVIGLTIAVIAVRNLPLYIWIGTS